MSKENQKKLDKEFNERSIEADMKQFDEEEKAKFDANIKAMLGISAREYIGQSNESRDTFNLIIEETLKTFDIKAMNKTAVFRGLLAATARVGLSMNLDIVAYLTRAGATLPRV